jgi:integrase
MVTLTAKTVENLRPATRRREIPDGGARGLYCIVQPSGRKSFAVRYRFAGRPKKLTLPAGLTLAAARVAAAAALHEVENGNDPGAAKHAARKAREAAAKDTFRVVAENYLKRRAAKLRSLDWQRRVLERLVYPDFGDEPVGEIKRRRIIALLDRVEDNSGAPMADMTLAVIRPIFGWHALRDENYANPIVKGMARIERNEHRRARILDDDELRAVWKTAEERNDAFGAYLRYLLLTAARRDEARELVRAEIKDGEWLLPAARNKTKFDLLRPLSKAARVLVESQPEIDGCPYIFTTSGKNAINSLSRDKRDFEDACGVTGWTLHDLRRTARSLMSRAGINSDHAERCLGHVIGGVRGTYDRHEYREEKRHAFEALAAQIERIVNPAPNIVPIRG